MNHIKGAKAAKDYYSQHVAPGDYYTHDSVEMPGEWGGKGAKRLSLSGEVKKEDFFALCKNRNPHTGEQITPRMKDDRRVLTDITFNAPKAVSGAYELGGDERVYTVHLNAVRATMTEMEEDAKARVRKGGADHDELTGEMVYALNSHRTARQVNGRIDFHLHTHATVQNMTFSQSEQDWRAIQLGDIVRDKGYYQAAYLSRLANGMKELGYGVEKDGNSFTLAGISRQTIEKFSQRTAVIEAEAERRGITSAEEKGKLGRKTREKKSAQPASMSELRKEWTARATPEELLALQTARHGWSKGDAAITPERAKEYALEHSFQKASTVSEKRLKQEALAYGVGSVLPQNVADITQHPEVIAQKRDGQVMTTTKAVLRDEMAMLQFAIDGQRKFSALVGTERLSKADLSYFSNKQSKQEPFTGSRGDLKGNSTESPQKSLSNPSLDPLGGLSDEQKKTALHVLNSRDTVTGIRGGPGTGKTHMLQTVNGVISAIESRSGDYNTVYAFAQSTTASRGELRKVGFKDAETLATLFKNEEMQARLHKQWILLDEAGQASTKEMKQLFQIAKEQKARVLLVGDYFQHSSVEAGDAFRLIEREGGIKYAVMKDIRRQTTPEYKRAVEHINTGTAKGAQKGFDALDKLGWVEEVSGPERHQRLVSDYLKAVDDGKTALIVAPTHREGKKLTEELRERLRERGAITDERATKVRDKTGWSDAQKGDARNYEPRMILEFHQNAKGFTRGDQGVVAEDKDRAFLQMTNGSRVPLPVKEANRFEVYRVREEAVGIGDRIRITKNGKLKVAGQAKGTSVNNGDLYTVEGYTKQGDYRLSGGKLMPRDFGHVELAYYDTSYKSQSKTVDRIFVAEGKESLGAANQQQWLVSTTRGREQAKIYVDSKEDVRNAIARTGQRLSAVELTRTKLRPTWRERFSQTFERNRVSRFIRQRADVIADYWRSKREGVTYA
ncbi:MobF family relaxase [Acidicapsa acidisoli]|uniref:MobF family relaxase n=1 Tax=Acidicapsa acidisoli TaxID=1615681 RepID=UPI0021DFEEEF|nr:MobF family relaxase [Acidicapsa acidisoli]